MKYTPPISFNSVRTGLVGCCLLVSASLSGCLGEPPLNERWTLLEIVDASPVDANTFLGSGTVTVTVQARITFRELLTGFLVAELRQSAVLTSDDTSFEWPDRHLEIARDVDRVLASSTVLGTATAAVTGFESLVRDLQLSFDANPVPGAPAPRSSPGLFLILYFSDDVTEEEVEGEDILTIVPVLSSESEILSTGLELVPVSGGG